MKKHISLPHIALSLSCAFTCIALAASVLVLHTQTRATVHASAGHSAFPLQLAHPQYWYAGHAAVGMQLTCQSPAATSRCFTPQQIHRAYHLSPLYAAGLTGRGHSIVIVDAFQSPTLRHDLGVFDHTFGLNDPTLHIFAPDGLAPFNQKDPVQVSWAAEITLDVEWAHAIAPGASINLVLANPLRAQTLSDFLLSMLRATAFAVQNNLGEVVSQSFGGNEACVSPQVLQLQHKVFAVAIDKHMTLLAASGDRGAAQINCAFTGFVKGVSTPASDPLVTAVGGTTLNVSATVGTYLGETAWVGSGGGLSTIFARPLFQQSIVGIVGNHRGLPDIAYDGDPRSGVLVVWSSSGQGKNLAFAFGGTSIGSPQWAGITVLLNQAMGKRIGFLNGVLYQLGKGPASPLHDIVNGTNTFMGKVASGALVIVKGFTAAKGWDPVTGWGTPDAANLVHLLVGLV